MDAIGAEQLIPRAFWFKLLPSREYDIKPGDKAIV